MTKEALIEKEIAKLNEIFEPLSENRKEILRPLIENAGFMRVTLDELQEKINKAGGDSKKTWSDLQAYNNLLRSYEKISARLDAEIPTAEVGGKLQALREK